MSPLGLMALLVLNGCISAWNAYAAGAYWTESKIIGGWTRFVTWCAVVMSACGFTWCYLVIAAMVGVSSGKLSPEEADLMFKLGYLVIILPVLGSGMGIWAHSLAEAYRRRTFGSVALASYNTYAQARNLYTAAQHAPGILSEIVESLGSSKGKRSKDSGGILIVLLVILLACAGVLTTAAIVRWADKRVALDIGREPQYA